MHKAVNLLHQQEEPSLYTHIRCCEWTLRVTTHKDGIRGPHQSIKRQFSDGWERDSSTHRAGSRAAIGEDVNAAATRHEFFAVHSHPNIILTFVSVSIIYTTLGWVSTERVTRRVIHRVTTRREVSFRIASFLFTLNASPQIKHGNAWAST